MTLNQFVFSTDVTYVLEIRQCKEVILKTKKYISVYACRKIPASDFIKTR